MIPTIRAGASGGMQSCEMPVPECPVAAREGGPESIRVSRGASPGAAAPNLPVAAVSAARDRVFAQTGFSQRISGAGSLRFP